MRDYRRPALVAFLLILGGSVPAPAQAPDSLAQALCDPEPTRNSFQCARRIESHQLTHGAPGLRRADTLAIVLTRGDTVRLIDHGAVADVVRYSYAEHIKSIGYYLVHLQYYEGNEYLLVHCRTGVQQVIVGPPVVSPDRRWFISSSLDLIANFSPNAVQVWQVTPNELVLKYEVRPSEWGPVDPRWISTTALELGKAYVEEATFPNPIVRDTLRLRYEVGRWVDEAGLR